jgi:phosphocarrier protein HPr
MTLLAPVNENPTVVVAAASLKPGPPRSKLMNGAPLRCIVVVGNPQGLHLRPSALFVQTAERFQSLVTVTHKDKTVNGKSVWDLLLLGAEEGSELTVEVDGPDAAAAMEALTPILAVPPEDPPQQPLAS